MYENRSVSETIRGLQADAERGLNAAKVAERRAKYGPNRLKDQEESCRKDCGAAERSLDHDSDGGNGDFHDVT